MSSIFGILNIGRSGIFANQTALAVTGNNIANVNTDGYSRQIAQFQSLSLGGAKIAGIDRVTDQFLVTRLREIIGRLGARQTLSTQLGQMESALGDADHSTISQGMSDLFSAMQDLSGAPSGSTEREALRSRARQLAFSLNSTAQQLRQLRSQIDQQVAQQVERVNTLADSVASLNRKILSMTGTPGEAQSDVNQLLDERDRLIDELSTLVPTRTIEDPSGQLTVFVGGELLVEGIHTRKLQLRVSEANEAMSDVVIADVAGRLKNMNTVLTEGSLGALIESRDGYARDLGRQIDQLAASLVRDFNVQHRQGVGLDGVGGRDFFTGLAVSAAPAGSNSGGAGVNSTVVLDDTQLTFQDYEIRFTDSATYDIVNATTGATVAAGQPYAPGAAIDFEGMRVVISNVSGAPAAGDVFAVNSYGGTTGRMDLSAAVAADAGAIAAGMTSDPGDNRNALALAALQQATTMGVPPSQNFEAYFDSVRLRHAMATETARQAQSEETISLQQAQAMRESVSGVSMDEEATHIIQYQRAFEASSRVIRVTDELLTTLLQMV
jgi:flagellar hook-associated protein 1 FlgK